MSGPDGSCGQSRDTHAQRVAKNTPVTTDVVVLVDSDGNDIAYLRAVMEREREHTTVTVIEEMVVENDAVKHWQRRAETASGEHIARQHTIQ